MSAIDDKNAEVVAAFRRHRGHLGGPFTGLDLLLLHHVGARSGLERITPLLYWRVAEDTVAVLASNYGADRHPAWYHNLLARPEATVEIGDETWHVRADLASQIQRERLLAEMLRTSQGVGAAVERTSRELPVVLLRRRPRAGAGP